MTPPTAEPADRAARDAPPSGPEHPDFGPRGYLPERAAKRARKILLREQMGLQWPIAALLAALLVLVVGGLYLWTRTTPPGAPFVAAGAIEAVDPRGVATITVGELEVLVVRVGGGVRVLTGDVAGVTTCPRSRRLSDPDGTVYALTGRALGAGSSLQPVPSTVFDGVLYVAVDPAVWPQPQPAAEAGTVEATC